MRAERPGRHAAGLDRRQHRLEVLARRVAAGVERRLALVELGVGEGDVALDDAEEDAGTPVRDVAEAPLHRRGVAGGVDHHVEEVASRDLPSAAPARPRRPRPSRPRRARGGRRRAGRRGRRAPTVAAPRALAKISAAMPIGPAPDHQHPVALPGRRAPHGVGADGEELDHRGLVEPTGRRPAPGCARAPPGIRTGRRRRGRRGRGCSGSSWSCRGGRRRSARRRCRGSRRPSGPARSALPGRRLDHLAARARGR